MSQKKTILNQSDNVQAKSEAKVKSAIKNSDGVHDIWRHRRRPLDALFSPRSVAVVGATDRKGSVGRTILWNLVSNPFGGTVYPVNPKRSSVLGIKSYPDITSLPEKVDLVIIVTPAETVPDLVEECVKAEVKGAIVISAGFKELGAKGIQLENQILERMKGSPMRLIGPNCLGVMNPLTGFNGTFAHAMAKPGKVGFISQSGALGTAVLDWSFREHVGFSAFISLGSMLNVGWGDLIDYLGDDPNTQSIVIYMESIGDARSFLSAAREVAITKPIIVIKAGRTAEASKAAASHTGALTGSDDVLDAAFKRSGVLRVDSIADIFYMAEVLGKQKRPLGPRLGILTNAGGPGVLATDAVIAAGSQLASLSQTTIDELNKVLPPHWSHGNPIDILGDAGSDRYEEALKIVAKDPGCDGFLVILTPQAMTQPTETAKHLKAYSSMSKPILTSWMGGPEVETAKDILNRAHIPDFEYPDTAARIFGYMWKYSSNLQSLYETPTLPTVKGIKNRPDQSLASSILTKAAAQKRTLLTELESKQVLRAYGIPTVETSLAQDEDQAVKIAEGIGFPVVLKLNSETITHKTDVGGVCLDLGDADAVREAYQSIQSSVGPSHFNGVTVQPFVKIKGYELIIGSSLDPQFGPVLLFGAGGELVEIFKDHALGLPPLNTTLARRLIEQTRIYSALQGTRGRKAVDLNRLDEILVLFSNLVVGEPRIKEIDINPLVVSSDQLIALDARIVLHDASLKDEELPQLVIRPYPTQYITQWILKDKTPVIIRPIRPEDEPLMVKFHEKLSEKTVHQRFFHATKLSQRVRHERLIRRCFNDFDREIALVVEHQANETESPAIIAVGRLSKIYSTDAAEFAIVVTDEFQKLGIGMQLMRQLIQVGRQEKISKITGDMLHGNFEMQQICKKLGFCLNTHPEEEVVKAEIDV